MRVRLGQAGRHRGQGVRLTDGCVREGQRLQPQGESLRRPRFEIGRFGGRLRLRQHGIVTQAPCKQARRRRLGRRPRRVSQQPCAQFPWRMETEVQNTNVDSRREARQAGRVGVLSRTSFDPITLLSPVRTRSTHTFLYTSLPIPFRHIGPCSAACSALPCPCVPKFPLSLPIAQFAPLPRISVMEPCRR